MDIKDLQKNWDELGKIDPLGAVVACFHSYKWDLNDFFNSGKKTVNRLMKYIKSLNVDISYRRALDFGCGVGRITQPLVDYFDEVYGVDISPSMIKLAKEYNRYGERCKYILNENDNLNSFYNNMFDLIFSIITLQHIDPQYSKKYIKEFIRILHPHGLLIFQMPNEEPICSFPRLLINRIQRRVVRLYFRSRHHLRHPGFLKKSKITYQPKIEKTTHQPKIEMYRIKTEEIVSLIKENRARIIDIRKADYMGIHTYYVVAKE